MKTEKIQSSSQNSPSSKTIPRIQYMRWFMISVALLGILGVSVYMLSLPIVQWALNRMQSRGLFARVETVRVWSGYLQVRHLVLLRKHAERTFRLEAPSAELRVSWWDFFTRQQRIAQISVHKPTIRISQTPKSSNTPASIIEERQKQWHKQRQQLLRLEHLHISDGILWVAAKENRRQWSLQIEKIQAHLRQFEGNIQAQNLRLQAQDKRRSLSVQARKVALHVHLDQFLEQLPPVVQSVALEHVTMKVFPLPAKQRVGSKPQTIPAHRLALVPLLQKVSLRQGELDLREITRQGKPIRVAISRIQADLQQVDPLYFWVRPIQGQGKAMLAKRFPVTFQLQSTSSGGQSLFLPNIPIAGLLSVSPPQKLPIHVEQGTVSVQVRLHDQPLRQKIQATVAFHVKNLQIDLTEHQPGFKGVMVRMAIRRIHRYFERNPEGYQLLTSFALDREQILERPEQLFLRLARNFVPALFRELRRRHPILRPFLPMIQRRLVRSPTFP